MQQTFSDWGLSQKYKDNLVFVTVLSDSAFLLEAAKPKLFQGCWISTFRLGLICIFSQMFIKEAWVPECLSCLLLFSITKDMCDNKSDWNSWIPLLWNWVSEYFCVCACICQEINYAHLWFHSFKLRHLMFTICMLLFWSCFPLVLCMCVCSNCSELWGLGSGHTIEQWDSTGMYGYPDHSRWIHSHALSICISWSTQTSCSIK